MKSKNRKRIFKLVYYSLMLSISVAIGIAESFINVIPVPGAKIGLSNVITVLLLYTTNFIDAFILTVLRVVIVSLLAPGRFLTDTFYMGLAGAIVSVLVMGLLINIKFLVPIIISALGSLSRVIAEVLVGSILFGVGIFNYLYIMLPLGLLSGILVGTISYFILKYRKDLKLPNFKKERKRKIQFYRKIF